MSLLPLHHYEKPEVRMEIAEYCRNRWLAIHCEKTLENTTHMMIRYEKGRPLTVGSESELALLINRFRQYGPRAFYATAHIYFKLKSKEDLLDRSNIVYSSPVWDIDSKDGDWRKVVGKAREIVSLLDKLGVAKSVFIKWSGRGAHVHINPFCFSTDIRRRIEPIDIAYSITSFVANRLQSTEGLVVENRIDIQRVFTTPLSLHRILNRVAVCFPPEKLEEFDISWTDPENYVHFPESWRRFSEGEGDELAKTAFDSIGPYVAGRRRSRKHKRLDDEILEAIEKLSHSIQKDMSLSSNMKSQLV
ncbi:MAG: hypothetical protein QXU11_04490 [Thermoproteota archaeon]